MRTRAVAHPNIALAKYWGKGKGAGNLPAVPSLSVTLSGMQTTTEVELREDLPEDDLVVGGVRLTGTSRERGVRVLSSLRAMAGVQTYAAVASTNDFPTASGLASSASGMAALAVAGAAAYGLALPDEELAKSARIGSASAARSLFSGFAELLPDGTARAVASVTHLPLRVLVCVTSEDEKDVSSTEGMTHTQNVSPYYDAWVEFAGRHFESMRAALLGGEFERTLQLAEESALAMHACAMAAGVVYVRDATVRALQAVRKARKEGVLAYATMDAGPHVKVLTREVDLPRLRAVLLQVPGVLRLIEARPGEGAHRVP